MSFERGLPDATQPTFAWLPRLPADHVDRLLPSDISTTFSPGRARVAESLAHVLIPVTDDEFDLDHELSAPGAEHASYAPLASPILSHVHQLKGEN